MGTVIEKILSRGQKNGGDRVTEGNQTVEANLYVNNNGQVDGKLEVGGNAHVSKNLKVEGFLDAPNIRGCSKGLFLSRESLIAKYPRPHIGWWAVVAARMDSSTKEGELYVVELDEYKRPYWEDTGETCNLAGLIDQFESVDEAIEKVNEALDSVSERVAALENVANNHEEAIKVIDEALTNFNKSIDSVNEKLESLDDGLSDLQKEVDEMKADGTLKERVDSLEGEVKDINETLEDYPEEKERVDSLEGEVKDINETLEDYPEEKEKWDHVADQLRSGRANNGTERFDGVYDSSNTTCVFYDDAGDEYDGVVWLCDKKMFVAYKAAAVSGNGCTEAVWFFFYHWNKENLYMEYPATEGGLWKDKLYMGEGHVWMWKRCDGNLSVINAAGDYEIITEEEIDEIFADFQFVAPGDVTGLTSVELRVEEPLEAGDPEYNGEGGVILPLSITEATSKEIDDITGKESD